MKNQKNAENNSFYAINSERNSYCSESRCFTSTFFVSPCDSFRLHLLIDWPKGNEKQMLPTVWMTNKFSVETLRCRIKDWTSAFNGWASPIRLLSSEHPQHNKMYYRQNAIFLSLSRLHKTAALNEGERATTPKYTKKKTRQRASFRIIHQQVRWSGVEWGGWREAFYIAVRGQLEQQQQQQQQARGDRYSWQEPLLCEKSFLWQANGQCCNEIQPWLAR